MKCEAIRTPSALKPICTDTGASELSKALCMLAGTPMMTRVCMGAASIGFRRGRPRVTEAN